MGQVDNNQSLEKISRDLQSSFKKNLRDYAETLLLLILLAIFIRYFFIGSYKVLSDELSPTLKYGDYVIGLKLPAGIPIPFTNKKYGKILFDAGDLVVFKCGVDHSEMCTRRLIGLPGDRMEVQDGSLYRNGKAFLKGVGPLVSGLEPVVPPDRVFLLGYEKSVALTDLEAEVLFIWFSREYDPKQQDFNVRWSRIGKTIR